MKMLKRKIKLIILGLIALIIPVILAACYGPPVNRPMPMDSSSDTTTNIENTK
jgi:hypothetical protein